MALVLIEWRGGLDLRRGCVSPWSPGQLTDVIASMFALFFSDIQCGANSGNWVPLVAWLQGVPQELQESFSQPV